MIPGVDGENLKVEIAEKHLLVSHEMEFETPDERVLRVPHVLAACPLSLDIDHSKITADFEDGILEVQLPLSNFTSGYRREIDINKH
jgi:HSP20 family molecular chaperone IbpA